MPEELRDLSDDGGDDRGITPEQATELAQIGRQIRREIEVRYAKMRIITGEELMERVT